MISIFSIFFAIFKDFGSILGGPGLSKNFKKLEKIIDQTLKGETPKAGSYRGRINSEPEHDRKTLMEVKNA